jgi:hypothetical protein
MSYGTPVGGVALQDIDQLTAGLVVCKTSENERRVAGRKCSHGLLRLIQRHPVVRIHQRYELTFRCGDTQVEGIADTFVSTRVPVR